MRLFDRILYSEGFALTIGGASLLGYIVGDSIRLLIWALFWLTIAEVRRLLAPIDKSLKATVNAQDYATFYLNTLRKRGGRA